MKVICEQCDDIFNYGWGVVMGPDVYAIVSCRGCGNLLFDEKDLEHTCDCKFCLIKGVGSLLN